MLLFHIVFSQLLSFKTNEECEVSAQTVREFEALFRSWCENFQPHAEVSTLLTVTAGTLLGIMGSAITFLEILAVALLLALDEKVLKIITL